MKLFFTIFAAIIAASVVIALVALAVLFVNVDIVRIVAIIIGLAAMPIAIDRSLAYYKA